jgi:hypothetical protein
MAKPPDRVCRRLYSDVGHGPTSDPTRVVPGYSAPVSDQASLPRELLAELREIGRLDLDLVVRDETTDAALATLVALREELSVLLEEARRRRRDALAHLSALEKSLAASWPGSAATELLIRVAEARRELAEFDVALAPGHGLWEEVHRRLSRRPTGERPKRGRG